jgi:hypothetical protein
VKYDIYEVDHSFIHKEFSRFNILNVISSLIFFCIPMLAEVIYDLSYIYISKGIYVIEEPHHFNSGLLSA